MAALSNWLAGLLRDEMPNSWKPFVGRTVVALIGFGILETLYMLFK